MTALLLLRRRPVFLALFVLGSIAGLHLLSHEGAFQRLTVAVAVSNLGLQYKPTAFALIKDGLLKNTLGDGDFGELGRRVQILTEYTAKADEVAGSYRRKNHASLLTEVEELAVSMFPWLRLSSSTDPMPFRSLRKTFIAGSRGIVIPVGKGQFRFAAHLISALRNVLHSKLPVVVAYAGDEDLPQQYHEALLSLGPDIKMLDITTIFDENLAKVSGSWAIKPFAMLASPFSETILLDADTALLQDPSVVFSYPAYQETGTFFFHDRLLWQHLFGKRHNWWENQVSIALGDKTASSNGTKATITESVLKSKVYMDDYAEEQDSGMVVMDKSRLSIVTALLHICWQNTPAVREDYTYVMMYGDKESWWFGLELCGVEYAFEENYGSIVGENRADNRVCSFTIAHPDAVDKSKLLWYNGSLLKNKAVNAMEYSVPEFWMTNATWYKGANKPDMSCMAGGEVRTVDQAQIEIVIQSVKAAKEIDEKFKNLINLSKGISIGTEVVI